MSDPTSWQMLGAGFIMVLALYSLSELSEETTAVLFALVWLGIIIAENND